MPESAKLPLAANWVKPAHWRSAVCVFAVVVVWLLCWYWETAWSMVGIWMNSDAFMHCTLIPFISAWLVWRQREALAQTPASPDRKTLVLMAIAGCAWLLGELAAVNTMTQFSLAALVVLAVPALFGWRIARVIAFPLLFLFFCVPFGDFLLPTMMEWTADFTVFALRLSGVPVYREGLQFVLPSGNWSVVEACSGIRYLTASVTVGSLFAYLSFHSAKRRTLFMIAAVLIPVVANWLRAYGIVMLGHLSGNKLATGVDHLIYGWLFFGVVMVLTFMVAGRWAEAAPEMKGLDRPAGMGAGTQAKPRWMIMIAVMAVTCLPQLANVGLQHLGSDTAPGLQMPKELGDGWRQGTLPTDWRPAFRNPSSEMHIGFAGAKGPVGLYVGYYRHQGYARKLVSSENSLVERKEWDKPDPAWAIVRNGRRSIAVAGQDVQVKTAELRGALAQGSDDKRLVAWQWYWVNGYLTSNDTVAKARIALLRLLGQKDDSAVIIVYAPKPAAGEENGALEAFVKAAGPSIEAALQHAREQP
jgi:exosortase A